MKKVTGVVLLLTLLCMTSIARAAESIGYDNGMYMQTSDEQFKLKANALLTGNYQGQMLDGAVANEAGYNLVYARLYFSGNAFGPEWSYLISYDLASGGATSLDAYANWMHSDRLNVRAGNFRVPYGFEFLVLEQNQQFAHRSIIHKATITGSAVSGAIPGRELGLMLWGNLVADKVDYWFSATNGAINGTGSFAGQGANDIDLRYTARLSYYAMGKHGLWMSDLQKSETPQLTLSAGANYQRIDVDSNGIYGNEIGASADMAYAYQGFSAVAEYHLFSEYDGTNFMDHDLNLQAGYFVADNVELAGRFTWMEREIAAIGTSISPSAVLNWYLHEQHAKVQIQYDLLMQEAAPTDSTDHAITAQLQFFI